MRNLDFETGNLAETSALDVARDDAGVAAENIRRIERSIQFMKQHLNQSLQASDLAAVANISTSHFFVLFKRVTGSAPIDYFIRLRMKQARGLLQGTSLQVKEIAGELGYCDPLYFSKLFKSVIGVTPTDYRKACHKLSIIHEERRCPEFSSGLRWPANEGGRTKQDGPNIFRPESRVLRKL